VNKQHWLDGAELVDSYRIFPRLFLCATFWWSADSTYQLLDWYTHLSKDERGLEASGFASVALIAVLGFLKLVYSEYSSKGRDWNSSPETTSKTLISTTTTTGSPP
jgi:hypothetical protein